MGLRRGGYVQEGASETLGALAHNPVGVIRALYLFRPRASLLTRD